MGKMLKKRKIITKQIINNFNECRSASLILEMCRNSHNVTKITQFVRFCSWVCQKCANGSKKYNSALMNKKWNDGIKKKS